MRAEVAAAATADLEKLLPVELEIDLPTQHLSWEEYQVVLARE